MAKRSLSDSECDDLFSDHKTSCLTPPESCGHQGGSTRKKRRGIIEKRRRDRINNSLSELRRLVPTAFEKQGSAKLEKAEILQMTVDHLKMIHSKGYDVLASDPQKFALDYHCFGFRECMKETGAILISEGYEAQSPFHQGVMSRLTNLLTQRELTNKQPSASPWTLTTPSYTIPHHNFNATSTVVPQQQTLMESPDQYMSPSHLHMVDHQRHQINQSMIPTSPQDRTGSYGMPPYLGTHQSPGNNSTASLYVPNGGRPYRPWGVAELTY